MLYVKKVKASRPCRIRLYESQKHMLLDATRSTTHPPDPPKWTPLGNTSHGVIFDLLLTDAMVFNGDWILSPAAPILVPFDETVMLVEPPAMVKITLVE